MSTYASADCIRNNYRHIFYGYVIFTDSLKGHHNKRVTTVKITLTSSSVYVFDVFAVHHKLSANKTCVFALSSIRQLSYKIAPKPHMIFVRKRNKRLLKVGMFSGSGVIATTEITGLNCNLFSLKSLDVSRYI